MPSTSKKQRSYFGSVYGCKTKGKCPTPQIKKTADSMSADKIKDFLTMKECSCGNLDCDGSCDKNKKIDEIKLKDAIKSIIGEVLNEEKTVDIETIRPYGPFTDEEKDVIIKSLNTWSKGQHAEPSRYNVVDFSKKWIEAMMKRAEKLLSSDNEHLKDLENVKSVLKKLSTLKKEIITTNESLKPDSFKVGDEVVFQGKHMIVDKVDADGKSAWATDEDGKDYRVRIGNVEHIKHTVSEMFPGSSPNKWKAIYGVNPFKVGDSVKLRIDVLGRHSKSVPAHMGYTTDQFKWRDTLDKLEGKVGKIERLFPNSKHVNVDFDGQVIGIDYTELEPADTQLTENKNMKLSELKKLILEVIKEEVGPTIYTGKAKTYLAGAVKAMIKNGTIMGITEDDIEPVSEALTKSLSRAIREVGLEKMGGTDEEPTEEPTEEPVEQPETPSEEPAPEPTPAPEPAPEVPPRRNR